MTRRDRLFGGLVGALALALVFGLVAQDAKAQGKSGVGPSKAKLPSGPGSLEGVGENADINYSMGLMSWNYNVFLAEGGLCVGHDPAICYNNTIKPAARQTV